MDDLDDLCTLPVWEWPDDAAERVERALRHGDANTQLLAAELAAHVINDDLARLLLELIDSDAEADVRAAAAIALGPELENSHDMHVTGDVGDISPELYGAIVQRMRHLYHDANVPELVRRRLLEASIRAPMPWHPGAVRAAYNSNADPWRATAVFCMGHIAGFEQELLEALEDSEPLVRLEAVRAAGQASLAGAQQYVGAILKERHEKELTIAAIEALPHLDPFMAAELVAPYTSSPDKEVAEAALDAVEEATMLQQFNTSDFDSLDDALDDDWDYDGGDDDPFETDDV